MESWEALKRVIGPYTEQFAKRLRLSPGYLYKMQRPAGEFNETGEPNVIDKVEEYIDYALSLGRPTEDALAPVRYLEERYGIVGILLPKAAPGDAVTSQTLKTVKEFGELCADIGRAQDVGSPGGGEITRKEYEKIHRDGWEAIRAIALLIEDARVREG
ncbi:MAG: hypothetical protein M1510_01545 [Nitrospirae bacterium]|nr:hypothetical protein [Nitrospirota bacterium]MCL5238623.1 hypothetical protein [Nitrospirota bacterium]